MKIFKIHKESRFKESRKNEEKVNIIMETVKKVRIETLGGLLEPIKYFQFRGPHRE